MCILYISHKKPIHIPHTSYSLSTPTTSRMGITPTRSHLYAHHQILTTSSHINISRNLGTKWGCLLIIKLWKLMQHIWICRSNALHQTTVIGYLSGMDHLKEAITYEYRKGLAELSHVYALYFLTTLPLLQKETFNNLKQ